MTNLTKINVYITKNIIGTGYRNDFIEYISLKEIGRKLNYEGNGLKDFVKWVLKQENLKSYVQRESVPNKSGFTTATVIQLENLKYVLPDLINKKNNKKINLISQADLIQELLDYRGDFIMIDSCIPYLSLDKFISIFGVSKHNFGTHLNNNLLTYTDFTLLIMKLDLYRNHASDVTAILKEFDYTSELSNQILSNVIKKFLHIDNNNTF